MRRFLLFVTVGLLVAAFYFSSEKTTAAESPQQLAAKAKAVLKNRCFGCHGDSGANEGGFNYSLNRKRLVRELIVPGNTDESKLFQRVVKGEMPPDGDKVPKDEVDTLKKWIEADAPDFGAETKRAFISPIDMLAAMLKDLEKANERDRPFYRYFTLTHLYNAGFEDNELESHRQGLSKLINSLSWGREVRKPVSVDPAKTILRIDLRHYKWNENDAWSQIIAADPYRVTYSSASATSCYALTKCELPHVRADWFVFAASRPPLYHTILDIPANVSELEKRVGVDVALNLKDYSDVVRAGFFPSGVSKSVRLIERHVSSYGAYWKSYDFKPVDPKEQPPKRRNLKANPTGPGGKNGFEHDGGEMIFNLPNGLQGYMLTDAVGKRIDKGPTDVVVDKEAVKRGRDPDVVNGVSCMNCHWSGMLNKTDQIRDHVLGQPMSFAPEVVEFVKAVYAEKPEFAAKLKEDRERFESAVKKCGLTSLAKSEPVATLAFQFDEPLDLDLAAAEAGVSLDKFTAALKSNAALGRELGSLPQGQPVPRDTFVQVFGALIRELKIGKYIGSKGGSGGAPAPFNFADLKAGDLRTITVKGIETRWRWIPPGKFKMGSPFDEKGRDTDEAQVDAMISNGFWMLETEVTQGLWMAVMSTTIEQQKTKAAESKLYGSGAKHPMYNVSHDEATEFCGKFNTLLKAIPEAAGLTVRLPTEAEWEYSARAGTTTRYYWGDRDEDADQYAWHDGNSNGGTQPVGQKKPNAWGLHDMSGNVWE